MKEVVRQRKTVRNVRPFGLHNLIADKFPEKFNIKTIYHYTSAQVVQSLLNPETAMFFKLIFVDHFNRTIKGLIDARDPHQYAFAIATFVCIFASVVKNASFSEEQEYRLMMQLRDEKYARNVEIVGGKPRLRISQKISSRAIQELISELWVSPHGDREVLRAVAHFLRMKYNNQVDVFYSNVPFNGR